jgi:hypothetical protein
MSIWTEYHVIQTNEKDLNFTVLNFAKSLLEEHNLSVDFEYNSIPDKKKKATLHRSDFVQQNATNHKLILTTLELTILIP